jgi:hypothetical protein
MASGCDLAWTISPDVRPQPLCSLHCSIFWRSTPESPPLCILIILSAIGPKPRLGLARAVFLTLRIAKALAEQPKSNHLCGPDNVGETYAVNVLRDEGIVDANGAGDALAGGSLGALVAGKSLGEATEVGNALGTIYAMQVSGGRKRRFCGRT